MADNSKIPIEKKKKGEIERTDKFNNIESIFNMEIILAILKNQSSTPFICYNSNMIQLVEWHGDMDTHPLTIKPNSFQ